MHATWTEFLTIVRDQVGSRVVETWFKAIVFEKWDPVEKQAYLIAPNAFVRDWVKQHYLGLIQLHLGRLLHVEKPQVFVEIAEKQEQSNSSGSVVPSGVTVVPAEMVNTRRALIKTEKQRYGSLNKNYSFENFIVGPNNSLAYAAAHAITQDPGRRYNPLFIYGKSGLGKTHLLHAIGNEIKARYQNAIILYQTADRFVTEFISAIRFNKVHQFQQKYHSIDVLLVDDVQFISRKEHTQEAFFHIFNALYEAHKQIVFSSDVYPHDMEGVADRLRSRLACGLVTDMCMPSLETKIAILKKKASVSGEQHLDDSVAHFIASAVNSNIRELEGALIRVMAFASLTKQPVTTELTQKVLQRVQSPSHVAMVDMVSIANYITRCYPYTLQDLRSKSRNKEIAEVRHIAMFLMKKLTNKSLRDIGGFLGGRDHSTVLYGLQRIEKHMSEEHALYEKISAIEKDILAQ